MKWLRFGGPQLAIRYRHDRRSQIVGAHLHCLFGDLSVGALFVAVNITKILIGYATRYPVPNIEHVRVYWIIQIFLGKAAELLAESRDAAGLS